MRPSQLVPAAVCAAALALPSAAAAHLRIASVAVDSSATVARLPRDVRSAVAVRVRTRDRAIELSAKPGHAVVVLGYLGEPFLRLDRRGLSVDASAPTAVATGLAAPEVAGGWRVVRPGATSVAWRDARLQGAVPGGRVLAWRIPLVVDGRRVSVRGTVRKLGRPSLWPWLIVAALTAAGLPAVALRAGARWSVSVAAAALAAVAVLAVCAVFGADGSASPGLRIESVDEAVLVLAGAGVLLRGVRLARAAAACWIGLVAIAAAATAAPVFVEGRVLATVPGTVVRTLVSLSLGAGLAAVGLGAAALRERRESSLGPGAVRLPSPWD